MASLSQEDSISSQRDAIEPSSSTTVYRELDPFAFWPHYASAMPGFGGTERSHERGYCFCTTYVEPQPGPCAYIIKMTGVRVTEGEIALRIHALRLSDPPEIGLTATGYIRLDNVDGNEINYLIKFTALEGLHYALFASFSQPSDIHVDSVAVKLQESTDAIPVRANLDKEVASQFAKDEYATSHRLVAPIAPSLQLPVSQPCTSEQLQDRSWQSQWPDVLALEPDPLRQWETVAALRALNLAGVDADDARGLLIGCSSLALLSELNRHSVRLDLLDSNELSGVWEEDELVWAGRVSEFDFVVSYAMARADPTPDAWLKVVGEGLRCLRGHGLGLFIMPFWTGTAHEPKPIEAAWCLDRNAVQQIALRLIGQRYSVAQLAFPPPSKRGGEITSFILIVHKLA